MRTPARSARVFWDSLDAEPVYSDRPEDLPEVEPALRHGYVPALEAPMWCFTPAIWPSGSRAWVRDRRVRHLTRRCDGGRVGRLSWTAADYAHHEDDRNRLLAELGLPARPWGGIWLLRALAPDGAAQDVLDATWAGWQASGGAGMANPAFAQYADRRLHEIF